MDSPEADELVVAPEIRVGRNRAERIKKCLPTDSAEADESDVGPEIRVGRNREERI